MILDRAKHFAIRCHDEAGCSYDGQPYEVHLTNAIEVAKRFQHLIPETRLIDEVLAAVWCHDVIEDAHFSYADVRKEIGTYAADLVYNVTDELGKNRKERALKTFPKIMASHTSLFVKLCDRIANVEYSRSAKHSLLRMYKKEYEFFRSSLETGHAFQEMWDCLDELLK